MSRVAAIRAPLFVPADRPERFEKAAASGADAIILDLEDAVAPDRKVQARNNLRVDFTDLPVIVRINAVGTPWCEQDLAAVAQLAVAAIMAPKVESEHDLARLNESPARHHRQIALIETARGLDQARNLAGKFRIDRLAFGSVDFAADIGCAHERMALLHARSEIVLASRLGGISAPLDGVTTVIDQPEAAADDAAHARALGFGGKLCIHPRQIEPVLGAFRPSAQEVAWAQRVLASGDGAVSVDGAMVDEPVRLRARRIVARV